MLTGEYMLGKLRLTLMLVGSLGVLAVATGFAAATTIEFSPAGAIGMRSNVTVGSEVVALLECELSMEGVLFEGPITTGLEADIGSIEMFAARCATGAMRPLGLPENQR
jgi:hypothetical protein